ncbi:tetratricopeptide repeat protein [Chelatococcus reniformis]|uniref:Tetratricopeptide repeat protein n=1 Tax=Chelatococcus reniformis TaxID=1494448 RepID=A0A916XKR0_9HYPH|nr:tetratricopeptide repeat protein [Chelatococcus reniformis]GGC81853.1 hypothetical protein GCM10010994_44750 [Chelatococcus reniformis]
MATLIGKLEDCNNGVLRGWVWDPSSPDRIIEPIIVVDDVEVGSVSADIPRRDLASAGIGDGRHGFEAIVPSRLRDGQTHRVLLRFPTDDELPANHARVFSFPSTPRTIAGRVEGVRAGVLFGWVWDRASPDTAIEVEIMARGEQVGSSFANVFRSDLQRAGIGTGSHGFRFQLSPAILDGDDELTLIVRVAREFGGQVLGTVKANDYTASKFGAELSRSASPSIKPPAAAAKTDAAAAKAGSPATPAKPTATAKAAAASPAKPVAEAPKPAAAKPAANSAVPAAQPDDQAAALAKMSLKELIAQATQAEAKGNLELADVTLRRAYELAPKDFDVLFRFARVTLSRGDIVFAKQLAIDALALRSNHVKPSIVVARIAELEGDRLLALEYWKNVPASDSAYFERLQKSARMLAALERPGEAITLLKEAATLRPKDMKLRETLAQLLQDLGEQEEALAAWQAILSADPAHKRAPGKIKAITKPVRDPGFVHLPRRYRGIMTCSERPFAVATGSDADAVLVGCALGAHLGTHFEAPALVVVPAKTAFTHHIKGLLPQSVKLVASDELDGPVELLFLVPEYVSSAATAPIPRANHLLSYSESGGQPRQPDGRDAPQHVPLERRRADQLRPHCREMAADPDTAAPLRGQQRDLHRADRGLPSAFGPHRRGTVALRDQQGQDRRYRLARRFRDRRAALAIARRPLGGLTPSRDRATRPDRPEALRSRVRCSRQRSASPPRNACIEPGS